MGQAAISAAKVPETNCTTGYQMLQSGMFVVLLIGVNAAGNIHFLHKRLLTFAQQTNYMEPSAMWSKIEM
jgi:hypothetical protein